MVELPEPPTLLLNLDKGVLYLTLNRPESRNAMSPEMLADIEAVFAAIAADDGVRAVVLRGEGGHFCAGADLKSMMGARDTVPRSVGAGAGAGAPPAPTSLRSDAVSEPRGLKPPAPGEPDPIAGINRAFGSMLRRVQNAPQVVIAVCEGAVLGGGFGLACVSDIAFAHVDAKFGMPETTRGLPPAQIAPFVVERIGLTQARRLALTGAQFRGAEALRLGLVHEGFASEEELQTKLADTLKQVLGCAPKANAVTKAILLNVGKLDMDAVLDDAAAKFAACVRGLEAPEGIAAFMQKRAPKWAQ
ncbi:enoyl-CoA hydratase/isomerase family protein [Stagnimonas aquatica]